MKKDVNWNMLLLVRVRRLRERRFDSQARDGTKWACSHHVHAGPEAVLPGGKTPRFCVTAKLVVVDRTFAPGQTRGPFACSLLYNHKINRAAHFLVPLSFHKLRAASGIPIIDFRALQTTPNHTCVNTPKRDPAHDAVSPD
jgi:hypothetical protein